MVIPIIEVDNSKELGYKIGKICKSRIKLILKKNEKSYYDYTGHKPEFFLEKSKLYLKLARKKFPEYYNELKGISEGSGTDFDLLGVHNCEEELVFQEKFPEKCTTIAAVTKDKILLGHAEGWTPDYKDMFYITKVNRKENPFFALGFMGSLPGSIGGFNDYLAFGGNSIDLYKIQSGIPKNFYLRGLLDARTERDVLKTFSTKPNAIGNNSLVVFKNRKIVDFEQVLNKVETINSKSHYVHTNHLFHPALRKIPHLISKESLFRYSKASQMLKNAKSIDVDHFKKILAIEDIMEHAEKTIENGELGYRTIVAYIIDLAESKIHICPGPPTKLKFKEFRK